MTDLQKPSKIASSWFSRTLRAKKHHKIQYEGKKNKGITILITADLATLYSFSSLPQPTCKAQIYLWDMLNQVGE
jgi:hypothetical protein